MARCKSWPRLENKRLGGRGILVTRPREQAGTLAARIEAEGGTPLLYPAMEIDDVADPAPVLRVLERLEEFEIAIFVSPTAVSKGLALARKRGSWPASVRTAGVGKGTREELSRHGIAGAFSPESGADSEALLALPELAEVAGKRILIFRGEGGRELLGDTLKARGAFVERVACYRRSPPRQDTAPILSAWVHGTIHAVTTSSSAGLSFLHAALGTEGAHYLEETPLFVSHPRIAEQARRLRAAKIVVAGPGDGEMVNALVAYFEGS